MCPIVGGHWNDSSNAGVWAVSCGYVRGASNANYGVRSDSGPPRTAQADGGTKGGAFLRLWQRFAKSAGHPFTSRHPVVLDRLGVILP